jgi:hypothetical protein
MRNGADPPTAATEEIELQVITTDPAANNLIPASDNRPDLVNGNVQSAGSAVPVAG